MVRVIFTTYTTNESVTLVRGIITTWVWSFFRGYPGTRCGTIFGIQTIDTSPVSDLLRRTVGLRHLLVDS